jgi:hypothetical protein
MNEKTVSIIMAILVIGITGIIFYYGVLPTVTTAIENPQPLELLPILAAGIIIFFVGLAIHYLQSVKMEVLHHD